MYEYLFTIPYHIVNSLKKKKLLSNLANILTSGLASVFSIETYMSDDNIIEYHTIHSEIVFKGCHDLHAFLSLEIKLVRFITSIA